MYRVTYCELNVKRISQYKTKRVNKTSDTTLLLGNCLSSFGCRLINQHTTKVNLKHLRGNMVNAADDVCLYPRPLRTVFNNLTLTITYWVAGIQCDGLPMWCTRLDTTSINICCVLSLPM